MKNIDIGENEQNQRLDRFLRKYLNGAPLGFIYKAIRKDVKVNGRRAGRDQILRSGDVVSLYIGDEDLALFRRSKKTENVRRQFRVASEDENILVVEKPAGLLTHGDGRIRSVPGEDLCSRACEPAGPQYFGTGDLRKELSCAAAFQ